MAQRSTRLVTDEIYHIFNRSIARQSILTSERDFQRLLEATDFYRFRSPSLRFSHYRRLPTEQKTSFLRNLYDSGEHLVDVYTFSFMPNHYHLLVKQLQDNGIRLFISQIQNSYAKYYNTKYERTGSLFQEMFKAVRIETDEQFIHIARYIHINPLTSFIIENPEELEKYPWTSFIDYMNYRETPFLSKHMLMGHFRSTQKLKRFTLNQVHYQRTLHKVKHLLMD